MKTMNKIIPYIIALLAGVIIGAVVVYSTTPVEPHNVYCYNSVSYEVTEDKVVETWLPANDICK